MENTMTKPRAVLALCATISALSGGQLAAQDMTPEMVDWASAKLGVGKADGLIDDYMALEAGNAAPKDEADDIGDDELADDVAKPKPETPDDDLAGGVEDSEGESSEDDFEKLDLVAAQ